MNILNKLTIKHLKMNKRRTIVTIIGIMLSTALMVGIGLLVSSFRDFMINDEIRYSGNYYLNINDYPVSKLNILDENKKVKNYYMKDEVAYSLVKTESNDDYVNNTYMRLENVDENYLNSLKLSEGVYPKSFNEIVLSSKSAKIYNAKVGDTIELNVGTFPEGSDVYSSYIDTTLELENKEIKTYKVVGIIDSSSINDEQYDNASYSYIIDNSYETNNVYILSKKAKDVYDLKDEIFKTLGDNSLEFNYHGSLLALYGVMKYSNAITALVSIILIILALISIGCTIVIYNSFAISVMERKKQFGLFASIGTTKKQIRHTVFFEAFIVGTIGIILGILASFIGIGIVLYVMNNLMGDLFNGNMFHLTVYPLFMIIPLIYMVFVIFFSSYTPAVRSSKVSPIEAIRQNDDIKINKRKIKTGKLTRKLFGIEGEIALKNIKRNKKKYRITIISLVTSIFLFIGFSSLLDYMFYGVDEMMGIYDYDYSLGYYNSYDSIEAMKNDSTYKEMNSNFNEIIKLDGVSDYLIKDNTINAYTTDFDSSNYTDDYSNYIEYLKTKDDYDKHSIVNDNNKTYSAIYLVTIDDNSYSNLKKQYNLKDNKIILINKINAVTYGDSRKTITNKRFNKNIDSINLCETTNGVIKDQYDNVAYDKFDCNHSYDVYMTDKVPFGMLLDIGNLNMVAVINESMYIKITNELKNTFFYEQTYDEYYLNRQLILKAKDTTKIDEMVSKFTDDNYYSENLQEEFKQTNNTILVVKILFYGFITLVTLIGVTSVFNTLNTSIALRKKEFAMLRSMGLTPKGFNKMIIFESIYFGIKSLIIGIPIGLVISYLLCKSTGEVVTTFFLVPYKSILIAIVAVFVIILLTMRYATNKIKHDNILEAIREENI